MSVFKTKKKLGGIEFFKKWDEWEPTDVLYVKILEKKETKNGKYTYTVYIGEIVNVDEMSEPYFSAPEDGEAKVMEVGDKISLTKAGNLGYLMDKGMEEEGPNAIFAVSCTGKTELPESHKYAGEEVHQFEVSVVEYDETDSDGDTDDL